MDNFILRQWLNSSRKMEAESGKTLKKDKKVVADT